MNCNQKIKIKNKVISNEDSLTIIAGPCAVESEEHCLFMADSLKKISLDMGFNLIFKSSFDKANRTSTNGERGLGLESSIDIFSKIKKNMNLPILTDVHETYQCDMIKDCVDIIQIPAFLARQTDLITAAASTNKIINIKKSQFMAPWDIQYAVDKVLSTGNKNILLTERGVSFGYNNLVVDFRSLQIMRDMEIPVIFDATHSVQLPGGGSGKSGGQREFVETLSIAAVSTGIACLFAEVHDKPENAISDSDNQLNLKDFQILIEKLLKFDDLAKRIS